MNRDTNTVGPRWPGAILLAIAILPLLATGTITLWGPSQPLVNHQLHAVVESLTALSLCTLGVFLLAFRQAIDDEATATRRQWFAAAFIGTGVLTGFHAAVSPGQTFVWYFSLATCFGGLLLSFLWLPGTFFPARHPVAMGLCSSGAATILALPALLDPDLVPAMVVQGRFTALAVGMTLVGGVGFLSAAWWVLRRPGGQERTILVAICLMFGVAGLLFPFSTLWMGNWWLWHLLRLGVSFALLAHIVQAGTRSLSLADSYRQLHQDLAEQNKTEAILVSANAQLQGVLDSATQISIIATDAAGTITVFNRGAERLLGYTAADMVGRQTPAVIHLPDEIAAHGRTLSERFGRRIEGFDVFVEYARQGEFEEREWTYRRSDGSLVPVLLVVTALRDESGRVGGFLGVARDISEHKQAEKRLAAQRRVAAIVAESPELESATVRLLEALGLELEWDIGEIWLRDEQTDHLRNAGWWHQPNIDVDGAFKAASLGITFPRGIGLPGRVLASGTIAWVPDVTADDNFPRAKTAAAQGLKGAIAFPIFVEGRVEGVLEFFSREVRAQDASLIALLQTVGSTIGQFIQRSRIEAERAQFAKDLHLLLECTNEAVYGTDLEGRFTFVNRALASLLGYQTDELLGQASHALIHHSRADGSPYPKEDCPVLQTIRSMQPHRIDDEVLWRKDGKAIPVEYVASPTIEAGVVKGAVVTVRDISARREAEQALAKAAQDLEWKNWELAQARDEALSAAKAKSEFLANMSHEIRTPMNGVIGMTGILLDTDLSPEQRHYATVVQHSGETLLTIINDILDFSKIEAGKLTLECIEWEVRPLVEEVLELLAGKAQEKGLELACLVHPSLPAVLKGDPVRIRQLLTNLVGNAIKFTERGEVIVRIEPAEATPGHVVRCSVSDTGIGISVDAQARLFQSFSQADGSTTRKYGGTGLGLAICKKLVELMGGQIGVQSTPGQGSTFWFTAALEPGATGSAQANRIHPSFERLKESRILIVDDNATNRTILEQQLGTCGIHRASVESGAKALERLTQAAGTDAPFDLAILDMQMPEMDGLQTAAAIKAEPALARVRLILLTSLNQPLPAQQLKTYGLDACLTKPMKQAPLFECLAQILGNRDTNAGRSADTGRPEKTAAATNPAAPRPADVMPQAGGRILVAEDNRVNQMVTRLMLEKLGYHVDIAANGRLAVDALGQASYMAVLMDCQMPEMDGFEATRHIRAWEAGERGTATARLAGAGEFVEPTRLTGLPSRIPIIAMTANAMEGDREQCLAAGMDDYITKPVTIEALSAMLQRWIPVPVH